ncbi:protein ATP1B4 [Clonorchis sinensis]|uniref:Protein ATP1B4 n=1 Tax=Clonorchis sinensis TaxID=79923 RepID=G7Y2U2_CLOSI|nr:protein ATP1B4 [Clonorchis sinensis]
MPGHTSRYRFYRIIPADPCVASISTRYYTLSKCPQTLAFYLILYAAVLTATAVFLILYTWIILDANRPTLTGVHSALYHEPGLSIVPIVDTRQTLIAYRNGYPETYATYLNALVAFVHPYDIRVHVQDTNYECILSGGNASIQQNRRQDLMTSACFFDLKWSYRCNVNRQFGYDDSSPCVILTLNRIYGWLPSSSDGVQVCCQGASPNDEDLLGTLCFYDAFIHDEGGCTRRCGTFPHQYYPYLNQNSYQSPLVFLEIRYPRKNVLIRIQCELNNTPNRSPITFELLID